MKRLLTFGCVAAFLLSLCACTPIKTDYSSIVESDYVYSTSYVSTNDEPVSSKVNNKPSSSRIDKSSSEKKNSSKKPQSSTKTDSSAPGWLGTGSKPQFETYIPSENVTFACYEALSATQKKVYNIIDNAVNQMTDGLISLGECTMQDMMVALYAVRMDRPEYFWMPTTYITEVKNHTHRSIAFSYQSGSGSVSYNCTKAERTTMQNKLKAKIDQIKKTVPSNASDYEIELILHDYVCKNTTYDYERNNENNLSAYGALVDGAAVCEGYARAMQLLLGQFGIPARLVCGFAGEAHMWNLVKIGGKWHHLDATWDDLNKSGDIPITMHYYFNISDDRIKDTHKMDIDFKSADDEALKNGAFNLSLPACNSLEYFYGNVEGIVLDDDAEKSMETLKSALYNAKESGAATCEVYINSNETRWEVVQGKYHLQDCITEVNKHGKAKIKVNRVVFDHETGRSIIFVLEYLK